MKKLLLLLIILVSVTSCVTAKISDEPMIVREKYTIHRNYYYKYFYDCRQQGLKVRVYSNHEYVKGQIINCK